MSILVTGGAGFIGSHLTQALVEADHHVRVLDDLSTGQVHNLAGISAEFIQGDVADYDTVHAAAEGCDLIFHQAALVSVPQSLEEPALNHRSNVTGFFNILEAARRRGVRRVVYASSAAIYGNLPGLPKRENSPIAPITPYAAAKYMKEVNATTYSAAYGLETIGLRYMNVFGPRQDPSSPYSGVLSIFCQRALRGQGCTIFGDGEQTRDFVFVQDVVQANLQAAIVPYDQISGPPVFNIGRGEQTSLNQILDILSDLGGTPIPRTHAAARAGDIRHSYADISRARAQLDFAPAVSVRDGLAATLAWFRREGDGG